MTLICAWRCTDGLVMCADSQETVNDGRYDYRVSVQKIAPEIMGQLQICICGTGTPVSLIESFIIQCRRSLNDNSPTNLAGLVTALETELALFYSIDVAACLDQDKSVEFIIGVTCPSTNEADIFLTENIRLRPAKNWELIGFDLPLYKDLAKRLYPKKGSMTINEGILAGVYLLMVAGQTSNYVGGETSVAVIRPDNIWIELPKYVTEMEKRLKVYESKVNELFLACSDTSLSPGKLSEKLASFSDVVTKLHEFHLNNIASMTLSAGLNTATDPYPKLPPGATLSVTSTGELGKVVYPETEKSTRRHKDKGDNNAD
jgi:hypothetical protein